MTLHVSITQNTVKSPNTYPTYLKYNKLFDKSQGEKRL